MARSRNNFKIETVEMIVLFLLQNQDLYGYQLTTLIKKQSRDNVIVTESTLYPTFYKLFKNSYTSDRAMSIDKRRVCVYYHLEDAGKERLAGLLKDYHEITVGIERILPSDLDFTEGEARIFIKYSEESIKEYIKLKPDCAWGGIIIHFEES